MHSIISTEGIVLTKRSVGEANTRIVVLTQNVGVVRVTARSARLERSKLRYSLEVCTRGRFALVRGKHEWKLTGAHDISRALLPSSLVARRVSGRIIRLLLRLVQGEEPVPTLFEVVDEGLLRIAQATDSELEQIEWILVLRILAELGYVEQGGHVHEFVNGTEYTPTLLERAREMRPKLIRTINESLGATGL